MLARRLDADRTLQLEICCALETLADELPEVPDLRLARVVNSILRSSWDEHTGFQEDVLFPILARRDHGTGQLAVLVDRLRREHIEISERNHELSDHLLDLLLTPAQDPVRLGYILRSAFENRRRHVELEDEILAPLLPETLAPFDRRLLEGWDAARPDTPFPLSVLIGSFGHKPR